VRALVADDDGIGAALLTRALEQWGLTVTTVHDGAEAWRLLQEDQQLSVVVIDWMMPSLEGTEICRRIRQEPSLAHLYVILLTGRDSPADVVAGLDAGADDYVVKPFDQEELRARVQVGIRVIGLQARLANRVAELQTAMARVKQLTGLLPICSYCKRIRSDEDYWEQVDSYIAQHSDAQFTHGICPSCYDKVRAEFEGRAPNPRR
jgi:DNA-binding response OmpR family regulator